MFQARGSLLLLALAGSVAAPMAAHAQIFVSIRIAPPVLPVYVQPPLPAPGYIFTPGYWSWDEDVGDYYWVPGAWVLAPRPGYLWTPAWWGWNQGAYVFHSGYWGPHVGFYGGINYGFGYGGLGYQGGYWNGGSFFYNRTVNRITNVSVTNVYDQTVVNRTIVNNVSFNGGSGGVSAQPTVQERAFQSEQHLSPTPIQTQHVQAAHAMPTLFAASNHGAPPVAATARAGELQGPGVVTARRVTPALAGSSGGAAVGAVASPARVGASGAAPGGATPVARAYAPYGLGAAGSGGQTPRAFAAPGAAVAGAPTIARPYGPYGDRHDGGASTASTFSNSAQREDARSGDSQAYDVGRATPRPPRPSYAASPANIPAYRAPPTARPSHPPPKPAAPRPHPAPHPAPHHEERREP